MHRVIFVKIELGMLKIVKKSEDPFSFLVLNRTKFFNSPQKFLMTFFFIFLFLVPIGKNDPRGSRNYKESEDPFSFLVLTRIKFINSPQKFLRTFLFFSFFSLNSKKMVPGVLT